MTVYQHVLPGMQADAARLFGDSRINSEAPDRARGPPIAQRSADTPLRFNAERFLMELVGVADGWLRHHATAAARWSSHSVSGWLSLDDDRGHLRCPSTGARPNEEFG
jgi:hypothetical protein